MSTEPDNQPEPQNGARPRRPSGLLVGFAALLGLAAVFSFAFTPLRASQDEWWHLKAGKWIVEHRGLPVNDIFTYAGADFRWYNHEWLSQVIFYLVYALGAGDGAGAAAEIGGVQALVAFKAVLVTATFALAAWLAKRRSGSWPVALLVALVAADISRRTIYPRPPVFSYLLFAGFLAAFYSWKQGRLSLRWLWLLVPVTAVWGNLHGMVLLAVVACGAFAAGEWVEHGATWWRSRKSGESAWKALVARKSAWALTGLTACVGVAAMAQPSGYHLFFLGRNFTEDPFLQRVIAEMLPPPPLVIWTSLTDLGSIQWGSALSLSFWLTIPVLLALLTLNRFRLPFAADYLLTGFFLFQALNHWRLLPLFALAAAGPLAYLLQAALARLRPNRGALAQYGLLLATAGLAAAFIFAVREPVSFFRRNLELVRGNVMDLGSYPRPLMDFLTRARLPDRMMSEINYSGYAIWRLSPERHKLFTDNRFDLFGSRFAIPESIVYRGIERGDLLSGKVVEEGWREILDRYGVNFVVASRGAPDRRELIDRMLAGGGWKHVYYYAPPEVSPLYGGFSVYLRNDPRFAEAAERAGSLFVRMHPDLPPPEELDRIARQMRTAERAPETNRRAASVDPAASVLTAESAETEENH